MPRAKGKEKLRNDLIVICEKLFIVQTLNRTEGAFVLKLAVTSTFVERGDCDGCRITAVKVLIPVCSFLGWRFPASPLYQRLCPNEPVCSMLDRLIMNGTAGPVIVMQLNEDGGNLVLSSVEVKSFRWPVELSTYRVLHQILSRWLLPPNLPLPVSHRHLRYHHYLIFTHDIQPIITYYSPFTQDLDTIHLQLQSQSLFFSTCSTAHLCLAQWILGLEATE